MLLAHLGEFDIRYTVTRFKYLKVNSQIIIIIITINYYN